MPDLSLPDISLHYEVTGTGPPLLMIAGLMSDSASWAPLLTELEPHFTLIRPDNRSTGRTTPWDAPCSLDLWAQDACALLDHLGYDRASVLGHSLGGMIGWHMAQTTPNRVTALMTMGTAPRISRRNIALFETLITVRNSDAPKDTWLRALFPWLFSSTVYQHAPDALEAAIAQSLSYPHAQSAQAMAHQLNALLAADIISVQSSHDVPIQALLGENDLLLPLKEGLTALKGIETKIIKNAGHSLHWDAPTEVSHIIRAFFQETPPDDT
ncbi:MAG: alpha/beta hydrolase [Paracoccaceae bacterium]